MHGRTRFEREIGQLGLGREREILDPASNTYLDRFLRREKQWPQWRVLALVTCGAIQIERQGQLRKATKAGEVVKNGERVHIADSLPASCVNALQQPAAGTYRDYAFAPGRTSYDVAMQKYLQQRPQTVRLTESSDLASFVRQLEKGDVVSHPVRHVVLGAHANSAGLLGLRMDGSVNQPAYTSLEHLKDAATRKHLEVPDAVFLPRPKDGSGTDIPPAVHVKGCRIGDNDDFMKALKAALGGRVLVTAPRHFHFFGLRAKNVIWEYMSYDFTVTSLTALSRDQLVDRYVKRKPPFTLIGNSPIAKATWEAWIPKAQWGKWTKRADSRVYKYLETPVEVVVPVTGAKYKMTKVAAVRYFELAILKVAINGFTDPRTPAGRKGAVRRFLEDDPIGTKQRLDAQGVASLDEAMDGDWRFDPPTRTTPFRARLIQHEYTVMRPVVDVGTNTLFMNIFPPQPRKDSFQLLESDNRFFGAA